MNVSRRELLIAGAVALPATGFWAVAGAQERVPAAGPVPPAGPPATDDPLLAAQLLIIGRKQIANCQFAQQHTQSADVRAFAEAEIREHQTIRARLLERGFQYPAAAPAAAVPARAGAPRLGVPPAPASTVTTPDSATNRPIIPPPGSVASENGERVATVPAAPPTSRPVGRMLSVGAAVLPPGASDMIQVEMEVADQSTGDFQREAGALPGLRFDKAFVGNQLYEHYNLFDRAVVFRRHASPAVAAVLDEARPVIERHIATLKQFIDRLDATR
jgi:predicted outer membrane protein